MFSRETEDETEDIADIFTAEQICDMAGRIDGYLGMGVEEHLRHLEAPKGYEFYVGRLAAHFIATDRSITSSFSSFERRHTDPVDKATGPLEHNSREYANTAKEVIAKQFEEYYQPDFAISLVGPRKAVGSGRESWERGISECQFLVMTTYVIYMPEITLINDQLFIILRP
ncbi:MAG: hypothetical protein WDN66_04355 [Candidatus Saccharibacteria bacterium]